VSAVVERRAQALWVDRSRQLYFGRCDVCGRIKNENGRPLLVARQARRRERECFQCWDERVSR